MWNQREVHLCLPLPNANKQDMPENDIREVHKLEYWGKKDKQWIKLG